MRLKYWLRPQYALVALLSGCSVGVVPPILLESGRLSYPQAQQDAKVEGSVLVTYDVSVEGKTVNIRVINSAPPNVFNAAAVAFVRTWRFQPQKRGGIPEAVKDLQSRISFTLAEGDASYLDFIK